MATNWDEIRQWLLHDAGQLPSLREVVRVLIDKLLDVPLPITRVNIGVFTIHPETAGYAMTWKAGDAGGLDELAVSHEATQTEAYLKSPIRMLAEQNTTLTFNLEDPNAGAEFAVIQEFRESGQTDYRGFSLPYGAGGVGVLTVCTQRLGGFTDDELTGLETLFAPLKLIIAALESRRLAKTVMRTYLGRQTGDLVLEGKIRRGEGELIDAALWLCDLRDFTALSEALGPEKTIAVMNAYFDCMAEAVWGAGGEILKFMGDAMLVVFRLCDETTEAQATERAYRAATRALEALERLDCSDSTMQPLDLRAGIALHVGQVIYGNIGAKTRLDFTIMGPAVNLLARLQSFASEHDKPIVMSSTFAHRLGQEVVSMGQQTFKGVSGETEVWCPAPLDANTKGE